MYEEKASYLTFCDKRKLAANLSVNKLCLFFLMYFSHFIPNPSPGPALARWRNEHGLIEATAQ